MRWLCGAMLAGGFLLATDGIVTIVWQEPLTALYTNHQQSLLRHQLAHEQQQFDTAQAAYTPPAATTLVSPPTTEQRRVRVAGSRALRGVRDARVFRRIAGSGDALGTISIPKIGVRFTFLEGTSAGDLARGPGHYAGTALPGEPGTVGIAGHRTTYLAPFRHLDALRRGDRIALDMPYGRFTYTVQDTGIVDPSTTVVLHQIWGGQRLVLTTCNPVRSAAQRIVVVAGLQTERVL